MKSANKVAFKLAGTDSNRAESLYVVVVIRTSAECVSIVAEGDSLMS